MIHGFFGCPACIDDGKRRDGRRSRTALRQAFGTLDA